MTALINIARPPAFTAHPVSAKLFKLIDTASGRYPQLTARIARAAGIVATGGILRHPKGPDAHTYLVRSSRPGLSYLVSVSHLSCSCPDYVGRKAPQVRGIHCCKHLVAALVHEIITHTQKGHQRSNPSVA